MSKCLCINIFCTCVLWYDVLTFPDYTDIFLAHQPAAEVSSVLLSSPSSTAESDSIKIQRPSSLLLEPLNQISTASKAPSSSKEMDGLKFGLQLHCHPCTCRRLLKRKSGTVHVLTALWDLPLEELQILQHMKKLRRINCIILLLFKDFSDIIK